MSAGWSDPRQEQEQSSLSGSGRLPSSAAVTMGKLLPCLQREAPAGRPSPHPTPVPAWAPVWTERTGPPSLWGCCCSRVSSPSWHNGHQALSGRAGWLGQTRSCSVASCTLDSEPRAPTMESYGAGKRLFSPSCLTQSRDPPVTGNTSRTSVVRATGSGDNVLGSCGRGSGSSELYPGEAMGEPLPSTHTLTPTALHVYSLNWGSCVTSHPKERFCQSHKTLSLFDPLSGAHWVHMGQRWDQLRETSKFMTEHGPEARSQTAPHTYAKITQRQLPPGAVTSSNPGTLSAQSL